ncbi:hypothetical protein CLOM_g14320 [Closterium sp. NIES-68]|nr:hypothetical protein CLOM_g14320 [Closterium sp. NIES-68]
MEQPINVLMVGAGEYTVGFVPTKEGAASDKSAGVIAITLMDLRRLGKVQRLVLCDRSGRHFPAVRDTIKRKIQDVYRDMDVTIETHPADEVEEDNTAYLAAMAGMRPGDMVTIFTPDHTHYPIALAAIQRGLHVLIAKPAVKSLQHHHHLVQAAAEKGVLVAVEFHKRFDPIYTDARDRIRGLGPFAFFSSTMTQPKKQLHTFAGWAGRSSDISFYLNSHHIDFHAWSVQGQSRPMVVVASAARGKANEVLRDVLGERGGGGAAATQEDHGVGEGAGENAGLVEGKEAEGDPVGSVDVEDAITLMVQWQNKGGSCGTALYTASWIAPPTDCHTQQYFHYMGHQGEVRVDQAHRGFTMATDAAGFATLNPLYMKYTPDAAGRFAGQLGYGYRSIAEFVTAAQCINSKKLTPEVVESSEMIATIGSSACLLTTAILEAGRKSLDMAGAPISIEYNEEGRPIVLMPVSP